MKEHIEIFHDSFVDYKGLTHKFTIAAVSQDLPKTAKELNNFDEHWDNNEVTHEVNIYVDEYGTYDYEGTVSKALYLGIAICNPEDEFSYKVGEMKAIARAKNSTPVLFARDRGIINSKMVKALLEQEADYIKDNPSKVIKGYNEMRDAYIKEQEMKQLPNTFSDFEKTAFEEIKKNPNVLERVFGLCKWLNAKSN